MGDGSRRVVVDELVTSPLCRRNSYRCKTHFPGWSHGEYSADYRCPDVFEVYYGVRELVAFGFAEPSNDENAVGIGGQNRGIGDSSNGDESTIT